MDYRTVLTTCTYCGCGCNFFLEVLDGEPIGTIPCKTSPVNQGKLCIKGWNVHEFIRNEKRLTTPLLRKNGKLEEASWDEALDYAATQLSRIKQESGPDSIGFLTSAKVTNEENFLLQKFARAAVNTNNVDHCARLWHSSTVAGLAAAFGSGAMTNSIEEFENCDCIFIIGSNTTVAHPLIATRIYRAKKNGAKIIVADPRKIHISEIADIHVNQKMGTDVALLNGIMHVILANGWHDQAFIDEQTEEFDASREIIENFTPEKAAEICGVSADDIRAIAECYGTAEKGSLVYCMGITQHTTGVDNVKSLANLAMLTGNLGKESAGVNPLRGQNNVQGACDMGGLPNVLTAYQPVTSAAAAEKFAAAWQVDTLSREVGLTIPGMLEGLEEGSVKALYVMGENPVVSDPDVNHVKKALKKAELLIVQDIFLTATAEMADVVLPGVCFAEKDGTFTNTERRVTRVRQAVASPGDSRQDWQIIQELSSRFGYPMNYSGPEEIFQEIASLTPSYGGITYARLEGEGVQWPCPSEDHPGTVFLHKGKIARGKGLFHPVDFKPPAENVDQEYPLWFSTGRVFAHYHTGTMTRNSPTLDNEIEEGFIELSYEDADRLGVKQGEVVTVSSRRGSLETKALVTRRVEPGSVFMPFHFIESCANILTNPAHDPTCKIPELKVCAVRVEKML